jgi:hypothetical protein
LAAPAQLACNIAFLPAAHLLGNIVFSPATPATPSMPAPPGFSSAAPAQLASNIAFSPVDHPATSSRQRLRLSSPRCGSVLTVILCFFSRALQQLVTQHQNGTPRTLTSPPVDAQVEEMDDQLDEEMDIGLEEEMDAGDGSTGINKFS